MFFLSSNLLFCIGIQFLQSSCCELHKAPHLSFSLLPQTQTPIHQLHTQPAYILQVHLQPFIHALLIFLALCCRHRSLHRFRCRRSILQTLSMNLLDLRHEPNHPTTPTSHMPKAHHTLHSVRKCFVELPQLRRLHKHTYQM